MIVVCLKWSARPGDLEVDDRFAGVSPADRAALEIALQFAERTDASVLALTVGPEGATRALRDALACGAARAVRIDAPEGGDSRDVAFEIARLAADPSVAATVVMCGDYSLDRGSGSVPAFVAHHLGAAQALGLVGVDTASADPTGLRVIRRLDGGRREELVMSAPCVLSVEGSVASLRRAGLRQSLASARAEVEVRPAAPAHHRVPAAVVTPYRPRARTMPSPDGATALERLRVLTDATGAPARGETVALEPRQAAERIVAALRDWGYLASEGT
ncbi:MAG: hypothetical protein RI958_1734 [Actinomycetota bacterium]|jgi:electron transfer flavoprotein beta subunit